jgi:Alkylmercury lyase
VGYPFSTLTTPHRVRISGDVTVFAMCAIDALGVSAMAGLPVVIESADPSTGEPITVKVGRANSTWHPATAVVYVGRTDSECAGPSASVCCGYMNFFTTGQLRRRGQPPIRRSPAAFSAKPAPCK